MLKLDLTDKYAMVTGVADDGGFAWQIAKSLQAAGAKVYLASHPRVVSIVQRILERDKYAKSRELPYGAEGSFAPEALLGMDVELDTEDDVTEEKRKVKGYQDGGVSIEGAFAKYAELTGGKLDILVHSVAFSPEIQKSHLETSRGAYLTAQSVSAYSLIALTRAAMPLMKDRQGSVVGLSYLAAQRVTPTYGGGMASAKASLECDARTLAWFAGEQQTRVNLISAGVYPSRAAKSIGDIKQMVDTTAQRSPLRRPITGQEVADAAVFLCSPFASGITGEVLYVDAGFNVMSAL